MKHILLTFFCVLAVVNGFEQKTEKEVNGKPDGIVKFYYETGELQSEINFSKGVQNGASTIYYKSGNLMKKMTYRDGAQVDTMKIYYESGQLQEVSIIKNGKKEGYYALYYDNGQLMMKGATKDGHAHGFCEHFKEDGKLEKRGEYYYGQPIGRWMEYDEIGATQKMYGKPNKPETPRNITIETFKSDSFILQYPNSWTVVPHQNPAIKFVGIPLTAEGAFKENLTVVIQPVSNEFKELNAFVDYVNSSLEKTLQDFSIISDISEKSKSFKYRDVVYKMTKDLGFSAIALKLWTRYFITNQSTYQITFSCEEENYDNLIDEVTDILNSFEIK